MVGFICNFNPCILFWPVEMNPTFLFRGDDYTDKIFEYILSGWKLFGLISYWP